MNLDPLEKQTSGGPDVVVSGWDGRSHVGWPDLLPFLFCFFFLWIGSNLMSRTHHDYSRLGPRDLRFGNITSRFCNGKVKKGGTDSLRRVTKDAKQEQRAEG